MKQCGIKLETMDKIIIKHNLVDILAATIIGLALVLAVLSFGYSEKPVGDDILLTVRVKNNVDLIAKEAEKKGLVYLNSVNTQVEIVSSEVTDQGTMEITLKGKGSIADNRYIFNGSRILIGQKAEIHGNFVAKGNVLEIKYANR